MSFLSANSDRIVGVAVIVALAPKAAEPKQANQSKDIPQNVIVAARTFTLLRFGRHAAGLPLCGHRRADEARCNARRDLPSTAHSYLLFEAPRLGPARNRAPDALLQRLAPVPD